MAARARISVACHPKCVLLPQTAVHGTNKMARIAAVSRHAKKQIPWIIHRVSEKKRRYNMAKHAEFDFLIVFVIANSSGVEWSKTTLAPHLSLCTKHIIRNSYIMTHWNTHCTPPHYQQQLKFELEFEFQFEFEFEYIRIGIACVEHNNQLFKIHMTTSSHNELIWNTIWITSTASLSVSLLVSFYDAGSSLNPAPDNTRVNSGQQSNNHGQQSNYNPGSYNPGSHNPGTYNPSNNYGGHGIDPNQIFGNPNRMPQANQPWNNLPIFPPNPTSGHVSPQQPFYPQAPQNYPANVQNPQVYPNGFNSNQMPFAFGLPPPGSQPYNIFPPRPTTRQPSLLDQFLYNKQGGRRNAGSTINNSWQHSSFIVILSLCNAFVGFILTARH